MVVHEMKQIVGLATEIRLNVNLMCKYSVINKYECTWLWLMSYLLTLYHWNASILKHYSQQIAKHIFFSWEIFLVNVRIASESIASNKTKLLAQTPIRILWYAYAPCMPWVSYWHAHKYTNSARKLMAYHKAVIEKNCISNYLQHKFTLYDEYTFTYNLIYHSYNVYL